MVKKQVENKSIEISHLARHFVLDNAEIKCSLDFWAKAHGGFPLYKEKLSSLQIIQLWFPKSGYSRAVYVGTVDYDKEKLQIVHKYDHELEKILPKNSSFDSLLARVNWESRLSQPECNPLF